MKVINRPEKCNALSITQVGDVFNGGSNNPKIKLAVLATRLSSLGADLKEPDNLRAADEARHMALSARDYYRVAASHPSLDTAVESDENLIPVSLNVVRGA